MSDIPHAHNTPRSMGHTRAVTRARALHFRSERIYVACGKEFYTLDCTDNEQEWLEAKRRCKGCEKKHPPQTPDLKLD